VPTGIAAVAIDTLSPHAYLWLLTGLAVLCAALTVRQHERYEP
jgi:hypothetical protein